MAPNRLHLERPGSKRVRHSSGITQYTALCGIAVYAVFQDERLVSCQRCLEIAAAKRRKTVSPQQ